MGLLNKEQVDALFHREAVMISTCDVVPKFRVAALFGPDAANHICRVAPNASGGYGIGDYTLMYTTYKGFLAAASFYNVKQLKAEADLHMEES